MRRRCFEFYRTHIALAEETDDTMGSVDDFIASAHVFTTAVNDAIEEGILKEIAEPAISVSQLKLLKLVRVRQAQSIGDVAAFLGISNAAASKAVDRLVRRRLLRRQEGEDDRRLIRLSLTDESRLFLANYDAARERRLKDVFGEIPIEELCRGAALLDRLSARIVEFTAESGELCLQCGIHFREECLMRKMLGRRCIYQQGLERKE
jgi:DNA-binding MarR family transcriptional regulator